MTTSKLTIEARLKEHAIREGQRAISLFNGKTAFVGDNTDIIMCPTVDRDSGCDACWMVGGSTAANEWIDSRPEPPTQPPGCPGGVERSYWLAFSMALLAQEQGFHVAVQAGASKKWNTTQFAVLLGPDDIEQTRELLRRACEAIELRASGRGFG
jgi:hypothetical protein